MPPECDGCPVITLAASAAGLTGAVESESHEAAPSLEDVDQYSEVKRAAEILSVSTAYLYRHKTELPFMIPLPGGVWRVSMRRLRQYMDDGEGEVKLEREKRSTRRVKRIG